MSNAPLASYRAMVQQSSHGPRPVPEYPVPEAELLCQYLALVAAMVQRTGSSIAPETRDDLMQEGAIALLQAIRRHDPAQGSLSAYAATTIKYALLRSLREDRLIRLPDHIWQELGRVRRVIHDLLHVDGAVPSPAILAVHLGVPVHAVTHLLQWATQPVSFDAPVPSGTVTWLACFVDEQSPDPLQAVIQQEAQSMACHLLAQLPHEERAVIRLRFGCDGYDPQTPCEVSTRLQISVQRVGLLERQALQRLRSLVQDGGMDREVGHA